MSNSADRFPAAILDAQPHEALERLAVTDSPQELLLAWLARPNAAALSEVAEHGSGAARKAARRAMATLKSRGIAAPVRTTVARLVGEEQPRTEAWMLPPDTNGTCLLVISRQLGARRPDAAFVFFHDGAGIQRIQTGELSASKLREQLAAVAPGSGLRPIPVPVEWARWRIAQARQRNAVSGLPEPLGLLSAKAILEPVPDSAPPHPFDTEGLQLSDEDILLRKPASGRLHQLPEFRAWLPPRPLVDAMLLIVGEQLSQKGVTPGTEPAPELLRETLEAEVRNATDRFFTPEARARIVDLLKDGALSVLARDGEEAALDVVATMGSVQRCGLVTEPPHEVPFLRGFFDKAVAVLAAQGQGSLRIPLPGAAPGPRVD